MTNITPPRELISQWLDEFYDPAAPSGIIPGELTIHIVTQAAQWGADQELDACCEWLTRCGPWESEAAQEMRGVRRPTSTLKEQALEVLDGSIGLLADEYPEEIAILRRALEALDD